jgi:hypothetical protein
MKTPKVIARNQLPARLPTVATIAWFLLLERFQAPQWLWGIAGFLAVLFWGTCIYAIWVQESVQLKELTPNDGDGKHEA